MKKLCLLLFLLTVLTGGGLAAEDEPEDAAIPSFRPGAEVTIGITVHAPLDWSLNPDVPLRVSFDKQLLKTAPFTVSKAEQDFKLKNRKAEVYVEVPVKLKSSVVDGQLAVPVTVQCGACTEDESQCTFFESKLDVPVLVQGTADDGAKGQALKKGTIEADLQLVFE